MSGPKRNADSLNTIGVVVVGICGAVMVYVSITALQAFYMNDTSELQTMADYGGQDTTAKSHKAEEMRNITEPVMGTRSIPIDKAMDLVVKDAKDHPDHLVPAAQVGGDWKPKASEVPHPGAPELIVAPAPAATAPAMGGTAGAAAAGAGNGSGSGAGSGAKTAPGGQVDNTNVQTPLHPTGSPADKHAVPGGGGAPSGGQGSAQKLVPGGHAR